MPKAKPNGPFEEVERTWCYTPEVTRVPRSGGGFDVLCVPLPSHKQTKIAVEHRQKGGELFKLELFDQGTGAWFTFIQVPGTKPQSPPQWAMLNQQGHTISTFAILNVQRRRRPHGLRDSQRDKGKERTLYWQYRVRVGS